MKFVLAFTGSRGDIQPATALGLRLTARGHDVVLAVPPNLTKFVADTGLPVEEYGLDTKELLDSELIARDLKSRDPRARIKAVTAITERGGRRMQTALTDLTERADVIIGGSAGQERAAEVAEMRGIPYVPLHYCPARGNDTVTLLPPVVDAALPGPAKRASWWLLEQVLWHAGRGAEDRLRAELNLPRSTRPAAHRISATGVPEIQGYDPVLFPALTEQWGQARPIVGFLDHGGTGDEVPDDLDEWLTAGTSPVYVGFGSMTVADPEALARAVVDATAAHGRRVLVAAGWGALADSPVLAEAGERVKVVGAVPHRRVLPRCVAAVHHGGAGTTAAALRAGIPSVVCSLGADQPMWGRRLEQAGVGTHLPLRSVDTSALGVALARVLRLSYADKARKLAAEMIAPDDACARAAAIVEGVGTGARSGSPGSS